MEINKLKVDQIWQACKMEPQLNWDKSLLIKVIEIYETYWVGLILKNCSSSSLMKKGAIGNFPIIYDNNINWRLVKQYLIGIICYNCGKFYSHLECYTGSILNCWECEIKYGN